MQLKKAHSPILSFPVEIQDLILKFIFMENPLQLLITLSICKSLQNTLLINSEKYSNYLSLSISYHQASYSYFWKKPYSLSPKLADEKKWLRLKNSLSALFEKNKPHTEYMVITHYLQTLNSDKDSLLNLLIYSDKELINKKSFDQIADSFLLLDIIKHNQKALPLVLYNQNPTIRRMVDENFLKKIIELYPVCAKLILNNPHPEIKKHINSTVHENLTKLINTSFSIQPNQITQNQITARSNSNQSFRFCPIL